MSCEARIGVHPPALSLPRWDTEPAPVDATGAAHLVVAIGVDPRTREVASEWVADAEVSAPTVLMVLDSLSEASDVATLGAALGAAHVGSRVMIVGGQFDVLVAIAQCRAAGAMPQELTSFVVHTRDLPMYCAHCRNTFRVRGAPGEEVTCPGCARRVEIHSHLSAVRGSFLASDTRARDLL